MPITEDASHPAAVHFTALSATTASFTPPLGSLILALVAHDGTSAGASVDTISDSLSGSWTELKFSNTSITGLGGSASVWCRDSPGAAMTVSLAATNAGSGHGSLVVLVLNGALPKAFQTGASGSTGGTSSPPNCTVTPTQIGSRIYGAVEDFTTNETLTPNANSANVDTNPDASSGDTYNTFKSSADTSSLAATVFGYNDPGGRAVNVAAVEILAASLSVDASSPVAVRDANATTTTASFTPPSNTLLVAFCHADANNGNLTEALTVSSTGGLSWSLVKRHNGTPGATVEVWQAKVGASPGAITVSVVDNLGSTSKSLFVQVFKDSSGGTPGIGASNSAAGANTTSYTSTAANSWGWGVGLGSNVPINPGASQTFADSLLSGGFDGGDSIWTVKQNAITSTSGTSVTMGVDNGTIHIVAVEITPPTNAVSQGMSSTAWHPGKGPTNARFRQTPRSTFIPPPVVSSLVRTNLLGTGTTSTGTASFTTGSFTPPNNSLLVVAAVFVENNGTTTDPTSAFVISDSASLTWTVQDSAVVAPTAFPTCTKVWTAPVTTGVSMTVTVGTGGRNRFGYQVSIVAYTGYDTSTPVGTTGSSTQNGGFGSPPTPMSFNLAAAPAATSEVFGAVGLDKDTAGVTQGSTYTEIHDLIDAPNDNALETEVRAGSTSTTVDWVDLRSGGGNLFNYAAVAIEVRATPSGGATQSFDATLSITAGLSATAASTKPVDSTLTVTSSRAATAASTKPVDASLSAAAGITAVAASTKPVDSSLTATASLAATAASTKPVDGSLAITATLTSDATDVPAGKSFDASLAITATITADAPTTKPVDSTLAITEAATASAVSTKPVDSTLGVSAARVAVAATTKPVDSTLGITASETATGASTKPIDATLANTATITTTFSDTPAGKNFDAPLAIAASLASTAASTKPVDASLAVAAGLVATGTGTKLANGSLAIGATIVASLAVTRSATAALSASAVLVAAATSGPTGVGVGPPIVSYTPSPYVQSTTEDDPARIISGSPAIPIESSNYPGRRLDHS